MCANAYVRSPSDDGWIEGDKEWEKGHAIGWQGDGLRGHVFVDLLLRVVIIAFKGTTTRLSVDGDDTVDNDRYNDNLLFSCCCAAESGTWAPEVCDCYSSSRSYLCSNSCVSGSLRGESSYYTQSLSVYQHVRHMYPMSSIWLTGHSLGGGIASLLGRTYNLPTITFCAPGEKLAGERLGIAGGAEDGHIYHVGNTADPIFMGACNGALAVCSVAGYALETGCHMGYECVYDTVNDNETVMSVGNHGIRKMVEIMEGYGSAPACERRDECRDCFLWDY
ncbi:triacylglycerol lipase, partial [Myxozyma melibiosi]